MTRRTSFCLALCLTFLLPVLGLAQSQARIPDKRAEPSKWTIAANAAVRVNLPFEDDTDDFVDAKRGFLAPLDPLVVYKETAPAEKCRETCGPASPNPACGPAVWDLTKYQFMNPNICDDLPFLGPAEIQYEDSVNPSLWRNAVLNTFHGVFEVVPGAIYQVRGYDLSNMSAVVGNKGWIIIDPLTTKETAAAALANLNTAYTQRTQRSHLPVSAVIFTHSHVDHFGGIKGLFGDGEIPRGVGIYAPEGFFEEAVSENVIAGNAMGRRASFMYGPLLTKGPTGQVDGGLGKTTAAGTTGIAEPTCLIGTGVWSEECPDGTGTWSKASEPDDTRVFGWIDGVEIQFQNVPGSEAPSEMLFYFPGHQALCASEDVTHTFHNVLTLRGANVRDALLWSKYLHKTLKYFGDAQVVFASHHWPTWNDGGDRVAELIGLQRDLYRYIHDQSVRLTNQGYTIQEVGELVELPPSLGERWFNRGYYGTVNHNAKAVYQRYMGWFDANPASLHQLPPAAAAQEYVRYMGGVESILEKARQDYERGHYRWVAMVLNHVVFSAPDDPPGVLAESSIYDPVREARKLLADTYDQLGYQAESGPWRNFYLTGAMELRNGVLPLPAVKTFTRETVEAMDLEMIFDFLAIHLNGPRAGAFTHDFKIDFQVSDSDPDDDPGNWDSAWYLANGVLNYDVGEPPASPVATLTMTRETLNDLVMNENDWMSRIQVSGPNQTTAEAAVHDLLNSMDSFDFWFNIVTPNPPPQ